MRPLAVALLACASVAWSAPSRAQGPAVSADAHDAYARGTSAFRRGDYASAAREYAAADALAPNPVALQAALDATVLADDPVFGTTLLDRARGERRTDALLTTMLTAEKKFAHRVGRIRLQCPSAPCLGAIDGAAAVAGAPIVVRVGSHAVTLEAAGSVVQKVVTVAPVETVVVGPEPAPAPPVSSPSPVPPPPPPPPSLRPTAPTPTPVAHAPRGGLSPVWVYAGAVATAVAGGFAIGFGVDTANRHASFARECSTSAPSCSGLASQGQDAQLRTNVLIGVTAGLGVATLVTALFVRWHDASLSVGAGTVSFDGRF
jgi:hypothetical protein